MPHTLDSSQSLLPHTSLSTIGC